GKMACTYKIIVGAGLPVRLYAATLTCDRAMPPKRTIALGSPGRSITATRHSRTCANRSVVKLAGGRACVSPTCRRDISGFVPKRRRWHLRPRHPRTFVAKLAVLTEDARKLFQA